jgi:hypothetical protein
LTPSGQRSAHFRRIHEEHGTIHQPRTSHPTFALAYPRDHISVGSAYTLRGSVTPLLTFSTIQNSPAQLTGPCLPAWSLSLSTGRLDDILAVISESRSRYMLTTQQGADCIPIFGSGPKGRLVRRRSRPRGPIQVNSRFISDLISYCSLNPVSNAASWLDNVLIVLSSTP